MKNGLYSLQVSFADVRTPGEVFATVTVACIPPMIEPDDCGLQTMISRLCAQVHLQVHDCKGKVRDFDWKEVCGEVGFLSPRAEHVDMMQYLSYYFVFKTVNEKPDHNIDVITQLNLEPKRAKKRNAIGKKTYNMQSYSVAFGEGSHGPETITLPQIASSGASNNVMFFLRVLSCAYCVFVCLSLVE